MLVVQVETKNRLRMASEAVFCDPAGARTQDPNIKSVVLYLLSYEFIVPKPSNSVFGGANVDIIFVSAK